MHIINTLFALLILSLLGCNQNNEPTTTEKVDSNSIRPQLVNNPTNQSFKDLWYDGKAEIATYELNQARYGEIHKGKAVLIFVTEPFSKKNQVKSDTPGQDVISILKMNATRKFNTGLYPYSTMQSVFTPVEKKDGRSSLKTTTSSQEWCGHTFQQLNLKGKHYQSTLFSYFESEGDEVTQLDKATLEDEIFNLIRIAPKELPQGDIKIIPSTLFTRFKHTSFKVEQATAVTIDHPTDQQLNEYQINYKDLNRTLKITFKKSFPHTITGWEESYQSGWGANKKLLTTSASLITDKRIDYWSKNAVADKVYRQQLGLE